MTYVTSDHHGFPLDAFLRLLEKAGFSDGDTLHVLGDVIDRNGDGGIATLRWIMNNPGVRFIAGNHECMMLDCEFMFLSDAPGIDRMTSEELNHVLLWYQNGASPTLDSLKDLEREELASLFAFLKAAPLWRTVSACGREFVLVHSGLEHFSPDRPLDAYSRDELIWYRPLAGERFYPDKTVILGHTPTRMYGVRGRMYQTDTWIDIDTGAAGGGSPMILRLDDLAAFYAD